METPSILLPAMTLVGVAVGGLFQLFSGRSLESRKHLTLQRSQAYADYFKAVALLAQGENKEGKSQAADAKVRICLYGSIDVVEGLRAFDEAGARVDTPAGEEAIVSLVKATRSDITRDRGLVSSDTLRWVLLGSRARNATHP